MTAQIFRFCDYQNPKDLERLYGETTLEQQAIEIMNVALVNETGGITDTAPCEMIPYHAPEDDPA